MSRFVKGMSGNPKGRPRKPPPPEASAFDIIFEQSITVTQDGMARELGVDEALQLKTYQAALSGNRTARREVVKMIAKREQHQAKRRPSKVKIDTKVEYDAPNADEAMLILGIVTRDQPYRADDPYDRYHLENWAVEAAIRRLRPKRLTESHLKECQRCTREPDLVTWPEVER